MNPPRTAAPDLANVSFAANMTAITLREAINDARYILFVMARTNVLGYRVALQCTLGRAFRALKCIIN